MKKALLLGLVGWLLAAAPAFAYPPVPANVNFTSERGVPFGLVFDGRPLTRGMARQVHVDRLLPGQHWADFTVPTAYGGATRFRSRVWLQPGLETTFVLVTRPGQPLYLQQVNAVALYGGGPGYYNNGGGRYNAPAPYGQGGSYGNPGSYPAPAPYGTDDDDNDDGYNNAPAPNGGYGTNPNYPNGGSYGTNPNSPNGGYGSNPNSPGGPGYGTPNTPNGGYGPTPNGGGYNNNGPTRAPYPAPAASSYRSLAPQDVDVLVRTVQARIAEASKLSAAKDGLAQRSLRTDELSRLLRTINSEACRIDLATFAYSHVSDPENFNRVYEVFETESGARAVEAAVAGASRR
ncbi:DUF4476 domain-containing protein [Hymenobacter sp. DH14]|uniref:DUF4476 domain-containing protein n=1 Tax=Hymenobacter cyanobacteriorum TaxID=2926463 RepID=A0A9X1VGP9_9BACT|nr:DUF4476 domain-containing protein [Hymenobacter cyanobacteriorum]MCI1188427.1 DUF4476 domain-containing protein [Hymenobacter cyanobacteriorum]